MLEKVIIKGFQKWRSLILDLSDPITILWGATDKGKSAILRALRWVCLNQRPKKYLNWKSARASVTIFIHGHKIKRTQGLKKNTYSLDGKVLKSFNKGVPDEISKILKLSDINFQRQHEAHFWISLPPIQVSKELNQIVDLSIIDRSLSKVGGMIREKQSAIRISKERLQEARAVRKELRWVVDAADDLQEIQILSDKFTGQQKELVRIEDLLTNVQNAQDEKDKLDVAVTKGVKLVAWAEKLRKVDRLEELLSKCQQLLKITKIQIPSMDTVNKATGLQTLLYSIQQQEFVLCETKKELNQATVKLDKEIKRLKMCPVCRRPM